MAKKCGFDCADKGKKYNWNRLQPPQPIDPKEMVPDLLYLGFNLIRYASEQRGKVIYEAIKAFQNHNLDARKSAEQDSIRMCNITHITNSKDWQQKNFHYQ